LYIYTRVGVELWIRTGMWTFMFSTAFVYEKHLYQVILVGVSPP
jgi:hypothetical protein